MKQFKITFIDQEQLIGKAENLYFMELQIKHIFPGRKVYSIVPVNN